MINPKKTRKHNAKRKEASANPAPTTLRPFGTLLSQGAKEKDDRLRLRIVQLRAAGILVSFSLGFYWVFL